MNSIEFIKIANEIALEQKYSDGICRLIMENTRLLSQVEKVEDTVKAKLSHDIHSYNEFIEAHFDQDLHLALNLYYAVIFAHQSKDEYLSKNIDDNIYQETMSDINIWANSYHKKTGRIGLEEFKWIRKHLLFKVFKLGRLQFEMSRLKNNVKGFVKNSECLNIHISEGEKLDIVKCQQSIEMAKSFFLKHFNKHYHIAVCHSWLLHENLKLVLDQSSNIIKFSQLFEIVENDEDCTQALERVFGPDVQISAEMPEDTSLQRRMKHFLLEGNIIGMGFGIIKL